MYKRQVIGFKMIFQLYIVQVRQLKTGGIDKMRDISCLYEKGNGAIHCLLYTSDAADDLLCVDLGGRRIIKKKNLKKKQQREK